MKSLKDIAWNVTETEYRADIAISYSTLSTFAREGHWIIPSLDEKKESEALRFGALVDCLLTEPETLEGRFFIADFPQTSDKIESICKRVYEATQGLYSTLIKIDPAIILRVVQDENYYPNWKDDTRIKDVIGKGEKFYNLLSITGGRILMSTTDYMKAQGCVETLKTHPFTSHIFRIDPFNDSEEKLYQLKFRTETLAEHPLRCMMDFCIVDHRLKTIRLIDLKTTGKDEEKFEESFIKWMYMLQGTLYTQIFNDIIKGDEYFKDFTILPFWFVVINRDNQTPIIWEFTDNFHTGDFLDRKNGEIYKGWRRLLEELLWHKKHRLYDYSYETYHQHGICKIERLQCK